MSMSFPATKNISLLTKTSIWTQRYVQILNYTFFSLNFKVMWEKTKQQFTSDGSIPTAVYIHKTTSVISAILLKSNRFLSSVHIWCYQGFNKYIWGSSDHYLLSHWTPDCHIHNHSWTVLYGNNFSCWLLYWQIFKCEGISTAIPKLRQDFHFILFFKKHCLERIKITTCILNEQTEIFKQCDAFTICFSKNAKPVSLPTYCLFLWSDINIFYKKWVL